MSVMAKKKIEIGVSSSYIVLEHGKKKEFWICKNKYHCLLKAIKKSKTMREGEYKTIKC